MPEPQIFIGQSKITILLCPITLDDTLLQQLEQNIDVKLKDYFRVEVPQTAPLTDRQYKSWNAQWPLSTKSNQIVSEFFEGDVEYVRRGINAAKGALPDLTSLEGVVSKQCCSASGVVITYDDMSKSSTTRVTKLLGLPGMSKQNELHHDLSHSERHFYSLPNHPLGHTVFRIIDLVAFLERSKRNVSSSESQLYIPQKRTMDTFLKEDSQSLDSSKSTTPLASSNYLCTGRDIFVTEEPCVMCAMALLHSRIGRVFIAQKDKVSGGFTRYRLHTLKQLNHRFPVFQVTWSYDSKSRIE